MRPGQRECQTFPRRHKRRNDVMIVVMLNARYAFASSRGTAPRQGGMEGMGLRPRADSEIAPDRQKRALRRALSVLACWGSLCDPAVAGEVSTANWVIVPQAPALALAGPRNHCSAAMVGRELALTAGHCVLAMPGNYWPPSSFKVIGPGSGWVGVKEIVPHPEYARRKRQGPDLALIQLVQPLPATLTPPLFGMRPIYPGDRLTIVG
jgi:hypothetical protein